jgi:dTMP kinase
MDNRINLPGGFFIVIEGIDGSGKSTLLKKLGDRLAGYFKVIITREPSDSIYGKTLRESFEKGRLTPEEELELFVKDRNLHINDEVKPYLDKGYMVISDRYFFSNIAYQSAYGVPYEIVKEKNSHFPLPKLVLYLYLETDTALKRISKSRGDTNKVETHTNINNVKSIYNRLEKEYEMFKRVDASVDIDKVTEQSINIIIKSIKSNCPDIDLKEFK